MTIFIIITIFVAGLLLASLEFGHRLRLRHRDETLSKGIDVVDAAVFGLMGLLLAFSFSSAVERFDKRRDLIVEETNAIGTAWLRIDLLPEATQPQVRDDFRAYLDARLGFYKYLVPDHDRALQELALSEKLQDKIWKESVTDAKQTNSNAVISLVLGSQNQMIDITTTRGVALDTHPPLPIYVILILLAMASSFVAGFGMGDTGKRQWMHTLVFVASLGLAIYMICDLEFPRYGVIRVDRYDQGLIDLRNHMAAPPAF
jgi:hypothetical protein